MIEFILELLFELFGQIILEALVEMGCHLLRAPFKPVPNPWLAAIAYLLFGAIAGGLTLLVLPHHLVLHAAWRVASLVLTPVAGGLAMMLMGRWRARRGDPVLRIDRFAYGYLFALGLGLVRFLFAH